MTENIPALTVRQPWAHHLLAHPVRKDVENRTWYTPHRGQLAVHVALQVDPDGVASLAEPITVEMDRDRGHIIGTVDVVDVHRDGSTDCAAWDCSGNPWAFHEVEFGPRVFHWRVENPRRLVTPIRARGRVGLWPAGPSVAHLLTIAEVHA